MIGAGGGASFQVVFKFGRYPRLLKKPRERADMADKPTRRQSTIHGITTYRRRPVAAGARRGGRPLFRRGSASRAGRMLARWRAALACFGAGVLVLAGALALPLLASSSAAADVDIEARAAAEAALLQSETGGRVRSVAFDVPALSQYPELPTGCESVALTNALIACGFDLRKTEIAENWLPTSDQDFVHAFLGDPASPDGNSCMAPAIASTASAYLDAQRADLEAVDLTGAPFQDVLDEVAAGNPVIAWCTIGLEEPGDYYRTAQVNGRKYRLFTNSHCVVVRGYDLDAGIVLASDSLAGQVAYPLETFAARYYALGAQAVVLRST